MTNSSNSKRLGQIHHELFVLRQNRAIIIAKYTKDVMTDKTLDIPDYNSRPALKKAELTLRLANDSELHNILMRINMLESEQIELQDFEFSDY